MKVYITPICHAQIMYYVNKSSVEISGLGRIEKASDGSMVVTKVYLLDQENTGTSTDLCPEAVAKLMFESREDKGDLNFWWHSHVHMNAFWSGTDMSTIKEFGKNGYLVASVFNKKGEYQTAYYQGSNGFLPELFLDKLETHFQHLPSKAEMEVWEKEYKEKAKEKTWQAPTWTSQGKEVGAQGKTEKKESAKGLGYDYWDNGYGFGYGSRGWDGYDDYEGYGNTPSKFSDPSYYTSNSSQTEEKVDNSPVIGVSTGYTIDQVKTYLKSMFYDHTTTGNYESLEVDEILLLSDVHEYIYGSMPTDSDMQDLFLRVTGNYTTMMEVIYDINDEFNYRKEDIRGNVQTEKGAIPVAEVITSRKGKAKLKEVSMIAASTTKGTHK
jgi:proteasome lid subunit RPN8/RPN11